MTKSGWVLAIALLGVSVLASAGQIYKWKDAQGRVHYSDVPPPAGVAKPDVVKTGNAPVSSIAMPKAAAAASKTQASGAEAESASAPAASEKDPKLCQQVRARKAFLQSNQLTKTVNDKGSVEFLSAEKRKAELAEVDKQIERFCP